MNRHITPLSIQANALYASITFALLFFVSLTSTATALANGADGYMFRYDFQGPATECAPGEVQYTAKLLELDSMTEITDGTDLQFRYVTYPPGGPYTYSTTYPLGSIPVLCAHHDMYIGGRVETGSGSLYQTSHHATWRHNTATGRDYIRDRHYHLNLHLKRQSDIPTDTISPVSPVNVITNINPRFIVSLNELPGAYPVSSVSKMYLFVCDGVAGTGGCNTFRNNLSGGLGTYSYGPTSIADGYFRWTNATQFNYTITPHNNWDYRYNPYTPYFEDGPRFLLDRVAPNSAASYSQGAGGGATIAYEFTNTAQDTLAGLADSTLFIENLTSGGLATQVHNFSVGSGIVGGPSDEQIITMSANLAYNTTYRYRFETTDAATNNTFTSWVTFTTPAPPAFSVDLQTPPTVTAGADFDLTWVTTGATNCTASLGTPAWQSSSPASGGGTWTQTGGITSDTTYRIECMDSGGNTQSDEETVVVEYECNDGINNDPSEDSLVDAADPGCWTDPLDPGTYDPTDDSEADSPQCNDGVDNGDPEDTLSDTNDPGCWTDPLDPGTYDPNDNDETDPVPQCSDGVDNADPEDTLADTNDPGCWSNPTDPGTYDPNDTDETDPVAQCGDGIDNDGDGYTDTGDPNCHSDQNPYNPASYDPFDDDESGPLYECNDGINNDPAEDSLVDADDPQCHTDNSPDGANPALDPSYDPTDNVEASPVDVTLTASDLTPPFAGNSTLTWTINSGVPDSCTATGDVANYSGGLWNGAKSPAGGNVTLNTILSTQTYTIRCERSSDGDFDVQSRTITPAPPVFPDIEITSDQVFARPGEDVQLTWSVSDTTNVSNCTITHLGPVSPNDISSSGPINAERTFTFVCEFYGLPFSDSVTVQVLPQIEET